MHPYPHLYTVAARAAPSGNVAVTAAGLPTLATAPPPEFDGPGGIWSPEALLVAAVADCFILTFRAITRASRYEWQALECSVEGVLERVDGTTRFTRFTTHAKLTVPASADAAKAGVLLEKAEHGCLISNSLLGTRSLSAEVLTAPAS